MKTINKILILIVLIIGIAAIVNFFTNNSNARIKKAEKRIVELERDIDMELHYRGEIAKERDKAKRAFKKTKTEFEKYKNSSPIEKIKTITIKEIEYVPKIEVIKEFNKLYQFPENLIKEFSLYIDPEKSLEENFRNIMKLVKKKDDQKDTIIKELKGNRVMVFSLLQYQKLQSEDHLSLEVFAIKRIYKNLSLRISYRLFYYLELESGFSLGLQLQIL